MLFLIKQTNKQTNKQTKQNKTKQNKTKTKSKTKTKNKNKSKRQKNKNKRTKRNEKRKEKKRKEKTRKNRPPPYRGYWNSLFNVSPPRIPGFSLFVTTSIPFSSRVSSAKKITDSSLLQNHKIQILLPLFMKKSQDFQTYFTRNWYGIPVNLIFSFVLKLHTFPR